MERFNNLQFHVQSDVGVTRDHNEDAVGLLELEDGGRAVLLVVADGMGGEAAGEVASKMLIDAFDGHVTEDEHDGHRAAMAARIEQANQEIVKLANEHPAMKGMGSTVVAARFDEDGAVDFVHVGDSRLYLYRDGSLERLTRDHSRVQLFVDEGILTPEQAEKHPEANVLTQAVGRESVRVDHNKDKQLNWHNGTFLVCSDGLTGMLPEEVICHAMAGLEIEDLTDALIEECNRLGATDNISIAVLRDGDPESPMTRPAFHREVPHWIATHEFRVREQEEKDDQARQQREADAHAAAEARQQAKKDAWDKAAEASLTNSEPPQNATNNTRARSLILVALLLAAIAAVAFWYIELRNPDSSSSRSEESESALPSERGAGASDHAGGAIGRREQGESSTPDEQAAPTKPNSDDPEQSAALASEQVEPAEPAVPGDTASATPGADEPTSESEPEATPEPSPAPPSATQRQARTRTQDTRPSLGQSSSPSPDVQSEGASRPRTLGAGSSSPRAEERPSRLGVEPTPRPSYELPEGPGQTATPQGAPARPADKKLSE